MRVPLSWLTDFVDVGPFSARDVASALTSFGLNVEQVEEVGSDVRGVTVAEVDEIEELTGLKKPIRYVRVHDDQSERWVICGATNFEVGDRVPVATPGATLPGDLRIESTKRYGRLSDGMICSPRELAVSDLHTGILVLPPDAPLGKDVADLLALRDHVLDIEVSPDRGYCLSIRGVAREAAAALHLEFRDPADEKAENGAGSAPGWPVHIDDPTGCSRYVACVVEGLPSAASSPLSVQRRLTLCGVRPISLLVDATNHAMLELGQPLHAFDRDRLAGAIEVRRAQPGERLQTLDGVQRLLEPEDLVIADGSGPVALAGVLGGANTEVTGETTAVVVESAHFAPVAVARTARRHRLSTEASRRFERGVDDAIATVAVGAVLRLVADATGRRLASALTDVDHRPERPAIRLAVSLPGHVAGVDYAPESVRKRLRQVGCALSGHDVLEVRPPSWRPDLVEPIDLVEEVIRLEGYHWLPARLPAPRGGRGLTREQRLRRLIARTLAANGYVEVRSLPFVGADSGGALLLTADDPRRPTVEVANPLSEEQSYLRGTLLPSLLQAVARNVGRGLSDLALYEIGSVFRARPGAPPMPRLPVSRRPTPAELAQLDAALPEQPLHLGVALSGNVEPPGWWGPGRPAGWSDAVAAVRLVAGAVGVSVQAHPAAAAPWHPGRCAELRVAGRAAGHAGELHPRVVEQFALPPRTVAAELALAPLLAAAGNIAKAPLLSAFPPANLDVALVVEQSVPAADVETALRDGAGPLLEAVRLFDVYTGPQLGAGRKSLAFNLRLRAPDRTLTDEEAVDVRDAAVALAAQRTGATLRGPS